MPPSRGGSLLVALSVSLASSSAFAQRQADVEPVAPVVELPERSEVEALEALPLQQTYVPLGESAATLWLESLGLLGLVTYTGFKDWKWGTASFRFNSEGWFGMDTGNGGIDKPGHAYGTYMSSEFLYVMLRYRREQDWAVSFYPPAFALLLYNYIELFDGYSVDHGWAYEDMVMNTSGALMSLLRNSFPRLRALVDYRLEYFPSKGHLFHPVLDYGGQKFFLVFKMAGIPGLERSPARLVEFFGGYYTRGFWDDPGDTMKEAHVAFGVGLSLEQLFFVPLEKRYGAPFGFMRLVTNYFQFPYTYAYREYTRTAPLD